jgi:hypothetical protein
VTTVEQAIFAWVVVFTLPKLLIVPTIHALRRALADTARQDEIDRLWLAKHQPGSDGGGEGWRHRRRRPPHPPPRRPRGSSSTRRDPRLVRRGRHREVSRAGGRR